MPKTMLIDAYHREETRVAVTQGGRVEDFDFEYASRKPLRGNIYLARVTRVEPSLQAAFIEYGGNRHGFLAFGEIHPDYYQIPVTDREVLRKAEALEVELAKKLAERDQDSDDDVDPDDEDELRGRADDQPDDVAIEPEGDDSDSGEDDAQGLIDSLGEATAIAASSEDDADVTDAEASASDDESEPAWTSSNDDDENDEDPKDTIALDHDERETRVSEEADVETDMADTHDADADLAADTAEGEDDSVEETPVVEASSDHGNAVEDDATVSTDEATAESDEDDAEADDAETAASLAKVNLKNAERSLRNATLSAPFDALVAMRSVSNFETISAGTAIARLHDMSDLRMEIDVPEILFQRAGEDPDVSLLAKFFGSDELFPLETREFNAQTTDVGQSFTITLGMAPQPGLLVLPGSSVEVVATLNEGAPFMEIPYTAVIFDDSGNTEVMVFEPEGGEAGADEGVVRRMAIETTTNNNGALLVTSGLEPGVEVVASGAAFLTDGQVVRRFTGFPN